MTTKKREQKRDETVKLERKGLRGREAGIKVRLRPGRGGQKRHDVH